MREFLKSYCRFLGQDESQQTKSLLYSLAAILVSFIIVLHLQKFYKQSRANYIQQTELASWLQKNSGRLQAAVTSQKDNDHRQAANSHSNQKTLVLLLSDSAASQNLTLTRLAQQQSRVTVTLNKVVFSRLMTWLEKLDNHGVFIEQANITRIKNNRANATLVFAEQ